MLAHYRYHTHHVFMLFVSPTSRATQRDADLLHLTGADVVRSNNEAFWIFIQQFLQKHNLLQRSLPKNISSE